MKKLKTILNYNLTYVCLLIIAVLFVIINIIMQDNKSIYSKDQEIFYMTIEEYDLNEEKLSVELKGKENLVGNLYIKSREEYEYFKSNLKYGKKAKIIGNLTTPINNTIPNCFNYKKYLNNKNIYYTITITKIEFIDSDIPLIFKVKNCINERLEKIDEKGYIKAFILGNKNNINEESYKNYQTIGITHLFALSGMHISLLSGIVIKILKKVKPIPKYLFVNSFLIAYGYIVSFPSSIKRCIFFFIINSINKIFNLHISPFKILILTTTFLVFMDYKIIYDVAFLYSISTVGGILLFDDFINDRSKIKSAIKLSIIAFLFSMPITLKSFYTINLFSIIYNIFYIPFVSIIIYPLSLLSFLFKPVTILFNLSINILEYTSNILSKISLLKFNLKLNNMEIIIYYLILILSLKRRSKILFSIIILLFIFHTLYPKIDNKAYIYFFDIGQGDSTLIIGPNQKDIILIDTGGIVSYNNKDTYYVTDNIITFLKSQSINKIDYLILSHGDADHAKEVEHLLSEIKINNVKINNGNITIYEKQAINNIPQKDYQPQKINISFLNYKDYNDENSNSLLTYINIYGKRIISFGDATKESEEDIIKKYVLNNVDIAKISHHGSNTSSSYSYLKTISPQYAIISSGRNNRFNHPNEEVISNLNKLSINYFNTQTSGTIKFIITKQNTITYQEYKP